MRRALMNALVDICCLVVFIPCILTGIVLYQFLPSGGGRGGSWVTWMGVSRHDWILYHNITGFAFAILLLVHLLLHWRFFRQIRSNLNPKGKEECQPGE